MSNGRRLRATFLPFAVCASIIASAQNTQTFTITTREVVLDVVVTDKTGHVVDDLSKDDFSIFENGVSQKIRSFETPEMHILPSSMMIRSTEELERKAPQAPCDIIVLDEMNTRFEDTAFARYAIRKYLGEKDGKLSHPTELLAVSEKRFQVLHEFTQDGHAIRDSLNAHLTGYPWNLSQGTSQSLVDRLALSLAALEQVSESTRGHVGHKNVIWIGRGFPAINTNALQDNAKQSILSSVHRMLEMLKDARLTLYTIDPTSLDTRYQGISNPIELISSQDENGVDPFIADVQFTTLAPATGGRAYFSRNDVDRELDLSSQAGANFYSISYAPAHQSDIDTAYRQIVVKVARPGLTATTRNGYYASSTDSYSASDRSQTIFDLSTALDSNLKYTDIDVSVDRSVHQSDEFVLRIGSGHLSWASDANGSRQAQIVVESGSFGKKGQLLGRTAHGVILHAEVSRGNQTLLPITLKVSVPHLDGSARIRFVVRDRENGRLGTAEIATP